MKGRIVIVAYKPKAGKSAALHELMKSHLAILKSQDLVSERDSIMMEAKDGTIIEVFEWKSKEAIEQAHTNPAVHKMWSDYAEVCEYIPVAQLDEVNDLFAEFSPVN